MFKLSVFCLLVFSQVVLGDIYDQCPSATCLGDTATCVAEKSCAYLFVAKVTSNPLLYEFELLASNAGLPAYVSVGLSYDNVMGSDAVVDCVPGPTSFSIHPSWNQVQENIRLTDTSAINLIASSTENGQIYCRFSRARDVTVSGIPFNLSQQFYVFIAVGTKVTSEAIAYHDIRVVSSATPLLLGTPIAAHKQLNFNSPHNSTLFGQH